jgi:uncharacterized protein YndB with AHSA1/START domain
VELGVLAWTGGRVCVEPGYRHRVRHSMAFSPPFNSWLVARDHIGVIMQITVETTIRAPLSLVWKAYTSPDDIVHWNAASDDWHTTKATVDLRPGGVFCSRMEAKDGSFGFDFEGTYTNIVPNGLIEYSFGDRKAKVEFTESPSGVFVQVAFDPEQTHSLDQQREGWQAILNRFRQYVEAKA